MQKKTKAPLDYTIKFRFTIPLAPGIRDAHAHYFRPRPLPPSQALLHVEWIDQAGDLDVTPVWAASPEDALHQIQERRWLKQGERLLGVDSEWDAVIVDGVILTRSQWIERQQQDYLLAMGTALFGRAA